MRKAQYSRRSNETDIRVALNVDGSGKYTVETGCGFLDHMLELFARHGRFDLEISCAGDVKTGYHHTVEDCAMALGSAFREALGERLGVKRYGSAVIPMDDALVLAAVDIGGRAWYGSDIATPSQRVFDFDTELVAEFMQALARTLGAGIHLRQLAGVNSHHIIEAAFKALAHALDEACSPDPRAAGEAPSTKGLLDL